MKRLRCFSIVTMLLVSVNVFAQDSLGVSTTNATTIDEPVVLITQKDPALKIGLGLGYRFNTTTTREAYIAQVDSTLQFQKLPSSAFVISATLIFQLGKRIEHKIVTIEDGRAKIYSPKEFDLRNKNNIRRAKDYIEDTSEPSRWSLMATLNLVDIDNNGSSFNKSIDGGLGIGYRVAENVHLGLFAEYANSRQLKSYINDKFSGRAIVINNEKISRLDPDDNNFFYNKPIISIAFKLVVALGAKPQTTATN